MISKEHGCEILASNPRLAMFVAEMGAKLPEVDLVLTPDQLRRYNEILHDVDAHKNVTYSSKKGLATTGNHFVNRHLHFCIVAVASAAAVVLGFLMSPLHAPASKGNIISNATRCLFRASEVGERGVPERLVGTVVTLVGTVVTSSPQKDTGMGEWLRLRKVAIEAWGNGRTDEALKLLYRFLADADCSRMVKVKIFIAIGVIQTNESNYEEAEKSLLEAQRLCNDSIDSDTIHRNLGTLYLLKDELGAACTEYGLICKLIPSDWYNLLLLSSVGGRKSEIKIVWNEILSRGLESEFADFAVDLVGPDLRFSKLFLNMIREGEVNIDRRLYPTEFLNCLEGMGRELVIECIPQQAFDSLPIRDFGKLHTMLARRPVTEFPTWSLARRPVTEFPTWSLARCPVTEFPKYSYTWRSEAFELLNMCSGNSKTQFEQPSPRPTNANLGRLCGLPS